MYFKRIEMHGFKSFAEPVTIEFHRGVTCVIGPNGSGKSNISDAIRWVLGEQSPKMLRGGRMEEVIFSGTESRRSRGMAEVMLVIDNSAGKLPVDYNEVAITRRIFRSGESEYLINGNHCRLRDIRELIMDTGIGVDGYSLIGQGKIADIVSNRTESRREIFEEAAGIVMYRTKKAESERKLDATSTNLERIGDIIGEIEGRIDSLREDSIRAQEYIALRERNKELEINITLNNIEMLEKKNHAVKADIFQLSRQLAQQKKQKESAGRQLSYIMEKSENLQNLMDESREKLMRRAEELNGLVNRKKLDSQRLSTVETDCSRLKDEISLLKEKMEKELAGAREWDKSIKEADQRLAEVGRKLQEKIKQHEDLEKELSDAAENAEQHKNHMFSIHRSMSSMQTEQSSLENLSETLEQRKQQILTEKSSGKEESRSNLGRLQEAKTEREKLEEQLDRRRLRLQQSEEAQAEQILEERQIARELEKMRISMGQLSARKKTIEEMESNYEGYNYAVKFIMKEEVNGIYGTVAELISVPRGFEVAIETALGAALQNIVCQDDQSAQKAIGKLKEKRAGRLTFLPLLSIQPARRPDCSRLQQETGFQGIGSDCIKSEARYRPVMEYLLNRVIIVDTMDHAIQMSKKAAGLRFVTLDGEIVNAGGAITGGKYKNRTANLLERKVEIEDLEKRLSQSRKKIAHIMSSHRQLQESVKKADDEVALLREQNQNLELELLGKTRELDVMKRAVEEINQSNVKWEQELSSICTEQNSAQGMISELEEKISRCRENLSRQENLAKQQMDLYDQKKEAADSLSEEITAARVEAGSCENRKSSANEIRQRIGNALEEIQKEIRDREKQLESLVEEKESLQSKETGIEDSIKEKMQERSDLEEYLQRLEEERTRTVSRAGSLRQEQETIRHQTGSLQTQKYELEIREAKHETQLNAYKEKLWDDFEVSYIQAMEFRKTDFILSAAIKENRSIKNRMKELGEVNTGAIAEYESVSERYDFLTSQRKDILESADSLRQIIEDMDKTIKQRFKESFQQVGSHFQQVFAQLFGGGHAELRLDNEKDPLESGIDIIAQPPGKKLQNINLLSGGEKTMTAIALMFAVLKTKPTPFCILDEVEAALDDANVERFARYLKTFDNIQFTLVTHQKATMEHADVLYGVTMPEQGISKVLSLELNKSA